MGVFSITLSLTLFTLLNSLLSQIFLDTIRSEVLVLILDIICQTALLGRGYPHIMKQIILFQVLFDLSLGQLHMGQYLGGLRVLVIVLGEVLLPRI